MNNQFSQYFPNFQSYQPFPNNFQNRLNYQQSPFQRQVKNHPKCLNNPRSSNQTNAFKPNSNIIKNLPKLTPVDTSSSNSKLTQKPRSYSQELINHQVDQNNVQSTYDFKNYFTNPDN